MIFKSVPLDWSVRRLLCKTWDVKSYNSKEKKEMSVLRDVDDKPQDPCDLRLLVTLGPYYQNQGVNTTSVTFLGEGIYCGNIKKLNSLDRDNSNLNSILEKSLDTNFDKVYIIYIKKKTEKSAHQNGTRQVLHSKRTKT